MYKGVCIFLLVFISLLFHNTTQAETLKDGTIVVYSGGPPIITRFIERRLVEKPYSHVAIVLDNYLYEAVIPRVRKTPITQHAYEMAQARCRAERKTKGKRSLRVEVWEPTFDYSPEEVAAMKRVAEENLDRLFRGFSFFHNRPSIGIHCCGLASTILQATGRYQFRLNQRVQPYEVLEVANAQSPGYRLKDCEFSRIINGSP